MHSSPLSKGRTRQPHEHGDRAAFVRHENQRAITGLDWVDGELVPTELIAATVNR